MRVGSTTSASMRLPAGAPASRLGGFDTSRPLGILGILALAFYICTPLDRLICLARCRPQPPTHLTGSAARLTDPGVVVHNRTGALGSYNSGILFFSVELRKAEVKACPRAVLAVAHSLPPWA